MSDFKKYRRTAIAEMADWHPGFDMTGVSISEPDREAGSPKEGDKIARNPKNHDDRWLVAAAYFEDNFAPLDAPTPKQREEREESDTNDGLASLCERLSDFRDAGGDPAELAVAIEWLMRLFIARHEIEAHPNLRTHSPEETVGEGCGICGGKLATIRGRYPGEDRREVCPTCLQERIEHAMKTLDPVTYQAYKAEDK